MAIEAHDEPEPLMGTLLLAPAGAAVMTSGMTMASAGTAARRVMAERNLTLVIAFSCEGAVPWPQQQTDVILHHISPDSRIVTPPAQDNKHQRCRR